jgi:hypothetical protein
MWAKITWLKMVITWLFWRINRVGTLIFPLVFVKIHSLI